MQRLVQMLSAMKVIKAFGAEHTEAARSATKIMRYFRARCALVRNRSIRARWFEFVNIRA